MARPATFDRLRSSKKPTTKVVELVLDPEGADEYGQVSSEVTMLELRLRSNPEDPDVAAELRDAKDKQAEIRQRLIDEEAVVSFTFKSIGREAYDSMLDFHKATKDQRDEARAAGAQATFNPDTFPPALVSASLAEPKLTVDEVEQLWKDPNWNAAELGLLFNTALEVNSSRRVVDLGKG